MDHLCFVYDSDMHLAKRVEILLKSSYPTPNTSIYYHYQGVVP